MKCTVLITLGDGSGFIRSRRRVEDAQAMLRTAVVVMGRPHN
jgi:hypothetical protein